MSRQNNWLSNQDKSPAVSPAADAFISQGFLCIGVWELLGLFSYGMSTTVGPRYIVGRGTGGSTYA